MGKIAFVFAGQGAQHVGMGADYYEASQAARAVFDEAERLRPGTLAQIFEGDEATLQVTANTQPCMHVVECAQAAALAEAGVTMDMAAGFSLGELSALTVAGAGDFATLFALVCERARLMQAAADAHPASMAAVLKLDGETVEALCAEHDGVYAVNFNCPGQVSVAGRADAMPAFTAAVKAAGGRAVPLKVAGGFHSPFMDEAAAAFAEKLGAVEFKPLSVPVIANVSGEVYGDVAATLSRQMASPVRWEKSVRTMMNAGVDTFIEIGPGDTLCGMIRRMSKNVRALSVQTWADLQTTINEVNA